MTTLATVIGRGTLASRPAASIAGELYYATDTDILYRDTGSAWQAVSNGGGTSNPSSPATNDRFFRTDLGYLIYYDGTRWLTAHEYALVFGIQDTLLAASTTSPQTAAYIELDNGTYDNYVTRISCSTTVVSTNSGSAFWTVTIARRPSGTSLASFNTSADTAGTNTRHNQTVNALTGTTDRYVDISLAKTSTPGTPYFVGTLYYRLVIT